MNTVGVVAHAEREGKWWAVTVDVPGQREVHTQARRLDQVDAMAREAVALSLDWSEDIISVEVRIVLPESYAEALAAARALREQADETNRRAAEALRVIAHQLAADGLSRSEIAKALDVSKSRAQQLVA
ncbi:hypothetical protein R8Z50_05905 [Longispora sp. K20-0274]|uniref:hypothetical protein n=1 Tax=Longispora sp. K20-0274 TaxID=3088255 RepID=UPI00399A81F5